ncbi:DNA polymerase type-B family catalytic domain protein [Rhizoctonia solani 123E]|uniref:DNA polymerase n=1 Tax=Rhizoctonia solani 123E TaxID=1423351 RepID=A0A074SBD2_9AGAM|nr:DNA polymerase type-B family catalytic domain protein [Rhizoctonia solani 123E]
MEPLKIQITNIDWSLVRSGTLDNTRFSRCPVIRVFGISSTGEKACIHIHQVYPYFYIPYDGPMAPEEVGRYIRSLTQALNRAIAISLKRNPLEARYVRAVILVKGVHFYGFHCSYSPFLKVIMADPGLVQRAATVLRSGVVLRQKIQTFETHISYIMQFMCDFGLYGCGWLEFSRYYLREGYTEAGIRDALPGQFSKSPHSKASRMSVEIDIISHQILNRYKLSQRHLHHKLNTSSAPSSEPLVQSVRELWDSERVRRLANGLNPTPELPREGSASQRGAGGQWEQEPLFWAQLRARMNNPKAEVNVPQEWEKWVMTAFESVEALWEEGWKTWMPQLSGRMPEVQETTKPATQVARELNPFGSAQVEQNLGPQTTHVPNLDDVDEDIAAGQALQKLVIAAEEGDDWHDTDEQWDDDLPIEDELDEMMATQVASRDVSVPTTPIKQRFRTTTPVPSSRKNSQFNTPDRTKSKSRSYASPTTTPSKRLIIKDSPSKFDRILEDLEKAPIPVPALVGSTTVINLTPGTHLVRTRADARIPVIEDGNPFLDAGVTYPGPAKTPRIDTSPVTKRRKSTHEPGQESTRKTTRWADLEEQLINITYRPQTSVLPASVYEYNRRPPSAKELVESLTDYGLPSKIYRVPYYSNEEDVPEQPMRYAGRVYHIKGGTGVGSLEHWESNEGPTQALQNVPEITGWEYAGVPPSSRVVKQWLDSVPSQDVKRAPKIGRSQIDGPTQNTHGFKITQKKSGSAARQKQTISAMSVEIFVCTRGDLLPNPAEDAITCFFYSHSESGGDAEERADYHSGCVVVCPDQPPLVDPRWIPGYKIEIVSSELDLLNTLIDLVREFDPDILAGWQVQTASWGYIDARCHSTGLVLSEEVARVSSNHGHKPGSEQWDDRHGASFRVVGRHVLNVWRIMRSEQSLDQYTYENVVFHLMHKRVPKYSPKTLTQWFNSDVPSRVVRVLRYWMDRTATVLDLLDHTELILRTAESARIIGVDFMSVLTRGSQFKVESIMFKIAKQENYMLISPSKEQVGSQNACECLPLVMEPESAFYSPLVVLDFQSLYPSIMIAYNYCYSTFLGRCALFQGKNKFGVTELDMPPGLLEAIGEENIHIAANGMAYAKRNVREGLLGRMLMELLDTRIMVKQAMKSAKGDRGLHKLLNARQLSLKLMCNVTFGYTMAGFSGRMPAAEIADSIVQSGRETLEKAIALIEATPKWGARVVYGDTDSLFIYLPGRTKDEAFRIGNEIANVVTESNPPPIKLKFEKVYYPCVLMTKKRYVGFKYENPDDKQPEFDAKGIETVRRDGIPDGQKMVERCLKILFRSQDFSEVKRYCVDSWTKILKGQASPQDFIFAKEVRLGTYSDKVAPPPGATVAARKLALDPMSEPQYGERIPYIIIRGEPGSRLVDRAVPPEELLRDKHKSIDENYYITHSLIPPLERIFNLVGANVRQWFEEMPKPSRLDPVTATTDPQESEINNRLNIDDHFRRLECIVCKQPNDTNVCDDCLDDPLLSGKTLLEKVRRVERRVKGAQLVCAMCTESPASETIMCESLDCPWMYARVKNAQKLENIKQIQALITQFPSLKIQAGEDSHSSDIYQV